MGLRLVAFAAVSVAACDVEVRQAHPLHSANTHPPLSSAVEDLHHRLAVSPRNPRMPAVRGRVPYEDASVRGSPPPSAPPAEEHRVSRQLPRQHRRASRALPCKPSPRPARRRTCVGHCSDRARCRPLPSALTKVSPNPAMGHRLPFAASGRRRSGSSEWRGRAKRVRPPGEWRTPDRAAVRFPVRPLPARTRATYRSTRCGDRAASSSLPLEDF
jgi:hypothetical protein